MTSFCQMKLKPEVEMCRLVDATAAATKQLPAKAVEAIVKQHSQPI